MEDVFDPLSYENLTRSGVSALMEKTPTTLPPRRPFEGPGVYALYYKGPSLLMTAFPPAHCTPST